METSEPAPESPGFAFASFSDLEGIVCPCGTARRAFASLPDAPASVHQVEISIDAKSHYHKRQTEIYYFLECDGDARIELNGDLYPTQPGTCVLIRPFTRHRAVGRMRILNIVIPPFDPSDEWFD